MALQKIERLPPDYRDVGLGFRFVIKRDGGLLPHRPPGSESPLERVGGQGNGGEVVASLGFPRDQRAPQQLHGFPVVEGALGNQSVVVSPSPPSRVSEGISHLPLRITP